MKTFDVIVIMVIVGYLFFLRWCLRWPDKPSDLNRLQANLREDIRIERARQWLLLKELGEEDR